ncbi:hypothetical protein MF406_09885 [Georgenia sp. TF02-10]|uniref:hypothetical protein n=1 Tax=Georgenia sp. TF02-10 TaxID=2917725 RepID=UPI001FA76803|nr:hypothetical protein [Georgenia sp. TF02-10]UNX53329.1 hypothetical protein MF406_09885 [Georgenia sp. TF02-10]
MSDPDAYPVDLSALLRPGVLLGVTAVVLVTLIWRGLAARLPVPELRALTITRHLSTLVPWVPRLLAAHLGVSLLVLAFDRAVLDPGIHVPDGVGGTLLLVPQAVVGALLVAGVLVRPAAVAIVIAGPLVVMLHSPRALATLAVLVGIAAFLFILPPRLENGGRRDMDALALRRATLALKLGTGTTLISLAVVEKLANPQMARTMLDQVPVLNLLAPFGVSADMFALFAGTVELMFGLLVISAALPQVVAVVAAVPFTVTLTLFGATELLGHLPVYGVLLALLVLGSREDTSRVLSGLRPTEASPDRHARARRRQIQRPRS